MRAASPGTGRRIGGCRGRGRGRAGARRARAGTSVLCAILLALLMASCGAAEARAGTGGEGRGPVAPGLGQGLGQGPGPGTGSGHGPAHGPAHGPGPSAPADGTEQGPEAADLEVRAPSRRAVGVPPRRAHPPGALSDVRSAAVSAAGGNGHPIGAGPPRTAVSVLVSRYMVLRC